MMIRITLKGNPGPLKGGDDHEITSDNSDNLREDSFPAARRVCGASGPLAGRCDADAPATLLLATAVVCVNRALGGPRVTDSRPARRACTLRTPRLTVSARRFSSVSPLSSRYTHWGLRYAPLLHSRGQETKSMVVLRTKVLTSDPFGYLPHTEHRGAMRNKRQIAAETKRVKMLRTRFSHIF